MESSVVGKKTNTLPPNTGRHYDIVYFPLGSAAFGGAERSLLDLSQGMLKRGMRVLIAAEEALRNTHFPLEADRRHLALEWVSWAPEHTLLQNIKAATRFLRRTHAPLFHFNIAWRRNMWVLPLLARYLTNARLIGSMRAMPDPHSLVPRRKHLGFIPGLQLWHIPEVIVGRVWAHSLHLTVSVNAQDFPIRLINDYGFSHDRIKVIHNGIEIREKPMGANERCAIRAKLGIDPLNTLICFVGRLSPEKGICDLLNAMVRLPEKFYLTIIGEGPQKSELQSRVDQEGLNARVKFLGTINHPQDFIAASDIFVVPSTWYEAFGRVVIEAMNEGVPVIASRIGGMAELFTDGIEGLYVKPSQPGELAEAIIKIGEDRSKLHEMGLAARRLVESRYSIERVIDQYSALYGELLPAAQ